MASIETRLLRDEPRYDVRYRDPSGRQRRKTFRRKALATRYATLIEADKLHGMYVDPDAGRITFQAYAEAWLSMERLETTTRETIERRLRLHVYPVLGSTYLRHVTPAALRNWLHGLRLASASSQRSVFSNVSTILTAAVEDGRIRTNPARARSVRAPALERRTVVPWKTTTVVAVREALPSKYKLVLDIGVGLGLRQGEIFGLSPDDIDHDKGFVHIQRQVKLLSDGTLIFGLPKNGKTRIVPLSATLGALLVDYQEQHPAAVVNLPWSKAGGRPTSVSLVLTHPRYGALQRSSFNVTVWKKALISAGVEPKRENGCHALRHHFASVLIDAGESIRAVASYLGHSDPSFTLRTYAHLLAHSDERARNAIDLVFEKLTPPSDSEHNDRDLLPTTGPRRGLQRVLGTRLSTAFGGRPGLPDAPSR